MSAGIAGVLDFSMPLDYFQICISPKNIGSQSFVLLPRRSLLNSFNPLEN